MTHTYAPLAAFNAYLRDAGASALASEADEIIERKLATLEAASRTVDAYCGRVFGPRVLTRRYDPPSGGWLDLRDDLLSLTSVTAVDSPGGTARTLTADTDFWRWPYEGPPWSALILHEASTQTWGAASRGTAVAGTWGWLDDRRVSGSTLSSGVTASDTTLTSSGVGFSPGQTLWLESEMVYVTAVSGTSLTVRRGQHGSTAAAHSAGTALLIAAYAPEVVDATLRLALRRWRARDAATLLEVPGSGTIPEGELTILRRTVGHLRVVRI